LSALSYPSTAGVTVEIIPSIDDRGNLTARVVTQARKEQDLQATYGDKEFQYIIKHQLVDLTEGQDILGTDTDMDFFDDLTVIDLGVDGVTYTVQPRKNEDGSKEYTLIKRVAQSLVRPASGSFTIANLAPELNRGGYEDNAKDFLSCLYASIPAPTTTYYFYDRLVLNGDGTYSGRLIERTYALEGIWDLVTFGDTDYTTWEIDGVFNIGTTLYRQMSQWKYECRFTFSYINAFNHFSNDTYSSPARRTRLEKYTIMGTEIWYAEKKVWLNSGLKKIPAIP